MKPCPTLPGRSDSRSKEGKQVSVSCQNTPLNYLHQHDTTKPADWKSSSLCWFATLTMQAGRMQQHCCCCCCQVQSQVLYMQSAPTTPPSCADIAAHSMHGVLTTPTATTVLSIADSNCRQSMTSSTAAAKPLHQIPAERSVRAAAHQSREQATAIQPPPTVSDCN